MRKFKKKMMAGINNFVYRTLGFHCSIVFYISINLCIKSLSSILCKQKLSFHGRYQFLEPLQLVQAKLPSTLISASTNDNLLPLVVSLVSGPSW